MGASSKGGMGGPNTAGPGGQGRDYNGNARGSNMPGEFNIGGPRMIGGGFNKPIFGAPPAQGDLYQPGGNRFMPGGGMVPPAGRVGNPRQFNPGQGGMRPGQPGQPGLGGIVNEAGRAGGRMINGLFPGLGGQLPPGSLDKGIQYGIGKMFPGMGGGKGGYPGPGRPGFGPAPLPTPEPIYGDGGGGDDYFTPIYGNGPGFDGGGMPGPGGPRIGMPVERPPTGPSNNDLNQFGNVGPKETYNYTLGFGVPTDPNDYSMKNQLMKELQDQGYDVSNPLTSMNSMFQGRLTPEQYNKLSQDSRFSFIERPPEDMGIFPETAGGGGGNSGGAPAPSPSFQNRSQVFNNRGRLGNQYTRTRAPRIR